MADVTYEDIDETGESANRRTITRDARLPKEGTLEPTFLKMFPGVKYFPSKTAHKSFKDWEQKTRSGTDDSILRRGFFKLPFTKWLKGKNVFRTVIGVESALAFLTDESKFIEWTTKKEAKDFLAHQKSFGAVVQLHRKTELKDEDV